MSFSTALTFMKEGARVAREGWNGKGMWICIHTPDTYNEVCTLPFIMMKTVQGDFVPWLASQTDILADDWTVA